MLYVGILLGLATGALLGLLGGGGSIVAVPIMVYIFGLDTKSAIGLSLIIVSAASFLAMLVHSSKRSVLIGTALLFGSIGAAGSYAGALVARQVPDTMQLLLFAASMAIIGFLMMAKKTTQADFSDNQQMSWSKILLAGLAAGLLTGLLGVGGGFIIVPALTYVVGLSMRQAIGTSLLVISINSMIGAVMYAHLVHWDSVSITFAASIILSAPVAAFYAHLLRQDILKRGFAIMLIALSSFMLVNQIY